MIDEKFLSWVNENMETIFRWQRFGKYCLKLDKMIKNKKNKK
jgi:hypothetical protein